MGFGVKMEKMGKEVIDEGVKWGGEIVGVGE